MPLLGTLNKNWILSKRLHVRETIELDDPEAIASMVHANLGVSKVPNLVVKPTDTIQLKRLPLGDDAPILYLGLAYHKDQIKPQLIEELFTALNSVIKTA